MNVKDWSDIYEKKDLDDIPHIQIHTYVDFGGIRTYDDKVYFKIEEGWILLDDLIKKIEGD